MTLGVPSYDAMGVSFLVLSVGEVNGFQRDPTVSLALGMKSLEMRCFGQEFWIFPMVDVVESRNLACLPKFHQ